MTMRDILRAFVYRDHMGDGWYAYYPDADDDSLDAGGSIPAAWFGTRNEAQRYVLDAIRIAAARPRESTFGMDSLPVNRHPRP